MRTYDFTPLYRSTIGFDRLARLMEDTAQIDKTSSEHPAYDIMSTGEDTYRITMAVAGFTEDELDIEFCDNTLTIAGKHEDKEVDVTYLHRGIIGQDFVRTFKLADHMVIKSAHLTNGVISVDLYREIPEENKPKHIKISTSEPESLPKKARKLLENVSKKKSA